MNIMLAKLFLKKLTKLALIQNRIFISPSNNIVDLLDGATGRSISLFLAQKKIQIFSHKMHTKFQTSRRIFGFPSTPQRFETFLGSQRKSLVCKN